MTNPLAYFTQLLARHTAPESREATTWAVRELVFGGKTKKRWSFARGEQTSASLKRKRIRKISHESRRRNRAA